ncbi:c-type cytochrome domain-containing protein [Terriglobus sp.]|uniref:c-type cytochrome domain-containing protein n=1 Tax=Terriglobus sp. TaxID=1889013 RepID=UPI003AFF94A4
MHAFHQNWLAAAYACAAAALLALAGCSPAVQAAGAGQASQTIDPQQAARLHQYQTEVLPTLQANCLRCHGGMNRRGGFNMSTRAALMQGGKDGAMVVLGRPEDSLLVRVINPKLPEDDPMRMPPKGDRLTDAQVAAIRKWVADGVVMDR